MKYLLLILPLSILASCEDMGSRTNRVTDSTAGVQLIPRNSPYQDMPVDTTDTTVPANIPVVDPNTSNIQPK